MRPSKTLLLAALVACLSASTALAASADTRPTTGNGIESIGTPGWPAVAAQLAKNLAGDSFAHDYAKVWGYLHPTYQSAVSQARWQRCQRLHPAAPPGVKITRVAIAQATELPVDLSLLGRQEVQEIQVYVQYTLPSIKGPQVAVLYTFWLKDGKTWRAVWLSDEYAALKGGSCYSTPQGSSLY